MNRLFPLGIEELDDQIFNFMDDETLLNFGAVSKIDNVRGEKLWHQRCVDKFPDLTDEYRDYIINWQLWYFELKNNGNKVYYITTNLGLVGIYNDILSAIKLALKLMFPDFNIDGLTMDNFIDYMKIHNREVGKTAYANIKIKTYNLPLKTKFPHHDIDNIILELSILEGENLDDGMIQTKLYSTQNMYNVTNEYVIFLSYDKNITHYPNFITSNFFLVRGNEHIRFKNSLYLISLYQNGHADDDVNFQRFVGRASYDIYVCQVNRCISHITYDCQSYYDDIIGQELLYKLPCGQNHGMNYWENYKIKSPYVNKRHDLYKFWDNLLR